MSLINQVLTDLDARRAGGGEAAELPAGVRAVAPRALQRDRRVGPWVAMLGVGVVIAVAASQWWPSSGVPDVPASEVASPVPPPQAASPVAPTPAPLAQDAKGDAAVPQTPSIPVAAGNSSAASVEPDLRLAQQLRTPRVPAAAMPLDPPAALRTPIQPAEQSSTDAIRSASRVESGIQPAGSRVDKQHRAADPAARARDRYRQALADAAQGRQSSALIGFREALALDPGNGEIRQTLLRLMLDQGDFASAESVLADGLQLDSTRSDWALLLSRLQLERGDQSAATALLTTTLARMPGNAELAGALGAVLHQQKRYAEAAQRYRQATAGDPGNGRYWLGLALALEAGGSSAEARAAYQRSLDSGSLSADLAAYARGRLR